MPRSRHSKEIERKGKEWQRTLTTIPIFPNRGRTESETPLPSPWTEFPFPAAASSSLPPLGVTEELELRPAIPSSEASPSASRGTGPCREAARVRHSAMYSDRPRRSRRNRGGWAQQSSSSRVEEEDAGKASSNELGPTISDASKLKILSLNESPPALDSTDGSEEQSEAYRSLNVPTFDSVDDAFEYFCKSEKAAQAARDKTLTLSQRASLEKFEAQLAVTRDKARTVPAQESSAVATQGGYEGSKENIAENGDKWMCEEVWVAFQKYHKKDLKESEYEFEKLEHQCFHVENYCKIFHHFNFTVKMKKPGSSEWSSILYFAEVKEILQRKIYFCCPLEPDENGDCYACKNKRMVDLKHPMIGAFDRGSPDTVFPFMYGDDSSSDDDDGPVYDEAWRTRMRAAGIRVG
ncbi:uncharacterized protein LOC124703946 isoform X2 [Lolium rigidum]|uniref:uncharacterized protein LOC124703946 isoform X2 n=1 Tax=Lolium rigidum TaxID=89674 RepID=UPI001F5C1AFB|nr:uncharacterized protein LOC124703946 isoform X2 [Lolium rigidum]